MINRWRMASDLVANRTNPAMPIFIQTYSGEVGERIEREAYELYERRGRQDGFKLDHGLNAEAMARKEMDATLE